MARPLFIIIAALALGTVPPLHAQGADNAQKALAKAQYLLRQTTSEKTALQTEVDALRQQVQTLTKQLAEQRTAAAARQGSADQRLAAATGKWRDGNEKLAAQLGAARAEAKAQAERNTALSAQLQAQTENFRLCYANNKKLYDINMALLDSYNNKGVVDALKQREPFTGIGQVKAENLIQDYQYQLDDLDMSANGPPPAAPEISPGS